MQDKKVMEFETFSPEETLELGRKLAREARPGDVYTLVGDLGVGKTVLHRESHRDLELKSRSAARHLPLFRYMKRGGCRSIILMSTVSGISRRWTRSDMRTILR